MRLYEVRLQEDVLKSVNSVRGARLLENSFRVVRAEELDYQLAALRQREILLGREEARDEGERIGHIRATRAAALVVVAVGRGNQRA